MKTLRNKTNPAIRITAPEIRKVIYSDGSFVYAAYIYSDEFSEHFEPEYWTLVEEEPTEGIKGNLEEITSNVDLEKEIEKAQEHYFALKDKGFSLDSMDVSVLARHFYELGKRNKEE